VLHASTHRHEGEAKVKLTSTPGRALKRKAIARIEHVQRARQISEA